MSEPTVKIEKEDGILWVTLNRPEALNTMNTALVDELHACFGSLPDRNDIRVVILRGSGRAFCAGLDLKEAGSRQSNAAPKGPDPSAGLRGQQRFSRLAILMRRAPQPIIACIHGPTCGGGFSLALASDVRIAGESVKMNAAFIRIGLSACDIGTSYFLPRLVGSSLASELLLTGRFIHAERALATGLVSQVVPDEQLEKEARALATEMLETSPLGLRLTKDCINASLDGATLEQMIAMEDRTQTLCASSPDMAEGVRAFFEKRPPRYDNA